MSATSVSFTKAEASEADINNLPHAKHYPASKKQDVLNLRTPGAPPVWNWQPIPHEGHPQISDTPLFAKLPTRDLRQLSTHGVIRTYPKHAILNHEQGPSSFLYLILSGKIKIYVSDEYGKEFTLNVCHSGEYFGEFELIDTNPCLTSAMTLEPSQLCLISRAGFQRYLLEHPEGAFELIHLLVQRTRFLTECVKSLALDSTYRRVVRTLLRLASERDGQLWIDEQLTHQDLANRVGASREMVSRILKDLRVGGYIKVKGGKITIQGKFPP
jgi:CRP/FNR family cyclic AMP-dependent transcriptional regulator